MEGQGDPLFEPGDPAPPADVSSIFIKFCCSPRDVELHLGSSHVHVTDTMVESVGLDSSRGFRCLKLDPFVGYYYLIVRRWITFAHARTNTTELL